VRPMAWMRDVTVVEEDSLPRASLWVSERERGVGEWGRPGGSSSDGSRI
jgi:hypothetical protein